MKTVLENYLSLLAELTAPPEVATEVTSKREDIENFCKEAPKIVKATFSGHPYEAYEHFVSAISPLMDIIDRQVLRDFGTKELRYTYRVRPDKKGSLTKEEIYHIPFQMRSRVSTQRYSIPGLPCLYLGGSLYTCWAEMGRPPFHELHASAFWLDRTKSVSILNFSMRPKLLRYYVIPDGSPLDTGRAAELVRSHLILWPLIALSSIIVKEREHPYKPEYIIPQLVLQWITTEHKHDGICYFSTHVPAVAPEAPEANCNFVFPAKEIATAGRCAHLRERFCLTDPVNWQVLSAINLGQGVAGRDIPLFDFEFIEGKKEQYHGTQFGSIQAKLNRLAREARIVDDESGRVLP